MKVTIEIQCDNAAFEDLNGEVSRILRVLAKRVDTSPKSLEDMRLMDLNGNKVGQMVVSDE